MQTPRMSAHSSSNKFVMCFLPREAAMLEIIRDHNFVRLSVRHTRAL